MYKQQDLPYCFVVHTLIQSCYKNRRKQPCHLGDRHTIIIIPLFCSSSQTEPPLRIRRLGSVSFPRGNSVILYDGPVWFSTFWTRPMVLPVRVVNQMLSVVSSNLI